MRRRYGICLVFLRGMIVFKKLKYKYNPKKRIYKNLTSHNHLEKDSNGQDIKVNYH